MKERYDAVGDFVAAHPDDIDPVVRSIIGAARDIPDAALAADHEELAVRRIETATIWSVADVLVLPTVPRLPTVAEVAAEPIAVNIMLGTYTNFVNLLGLCAVSIPVGAPSTDGPPASLMVIAAGGRDELLLDIAVALCQPGSTIDR